jgi:2-dehydro-3-deoxyglucarate aldolase/4-hydroxy-2-oxoheptanedioate aldolase
MHKPPGMPPPTALFERPLRPLLRPGNTLRLVWLALGNVPLAEIAAHARPDVLVLDLQHGLWERGALEAAIGLAQRHVPVLARTTDSSLPAVAQALDAGAAGVLVPLVESADDARRIVESGRYPPLGRRSAGGVRPLMHGVPAMLDAGAQVALGALIETARGVANAEEICAVEGLDFIFIGTGDLALSLGPGKPGALARACAQVRRAAQARGLACGLFTGTLAAARKALADGYEMAVVANDIDLAVRGIGEAVRGIPAARTSRPGRSRKGSKT